ncbi:hypothetical protein Cva_00843 [Caedimonas varicaedens]|uniref:Uncharacterized protein n=1 Tax=Caedimonas varicaedens TaxID=1629334 RepID=A0A0K8MCB7_9PROT|nr:hypothetical protein Cva_00843 [Caedimonas varicaedens]
MTVADLIEELQKMPQHYDIRIDDGVESYPVYGVRPVLGGDCFIYADRDEDDFDDEEDEE